MFKGPPETASPFLNKRANFAPPQKKQRNKIFKLKSKKTFILKAAIIC